MEYIHWEGGDGLRAANRWRMFNTGTLYKKYYKNTTYNASTPVHGTATLTSVCVCVCFPSPPPPHLLLAQVYYAAPGGDGGGGEERLLVRTNGQDFGPRELRQRPRPAATAGVYGE